jgi:adenine phosphoribosyltransferase
VRDIPDFPKPGIVFKDIMPLLQNRDGLRLVIDRLADVFSRDRADLVVSTEARGFLIGPAIAYHLGTGYAAVRKPGKLPFATRTVEYELEYGSDQLQIHTDAVIEGQRVLLIDDLLATGGTAAATAQLVTQLGGQAIGFGFIIELTFLNGRARLPEGLKVVSLLQYGAPPAEL